MSPKVNNQYKKNKELEILQSAKNVFIKKGYLKATMQDIIVEACISRGALYSYFNNIEHVFEELLKLEDEKDIIYFERERVSSFWDQLIAWIRLQQRNIVSTNNAFLLCKTEYFLKKYRESKKISNPYVIKRYERLVSSITNCIDRGIENKEFYSHKSSKAVALYIVSFLDGLMLDTFNLGMEVTEVNEQIDVLIFTLENILCPIK
jgi:AcrR family transcriptional regulator